MVSLQSQYLLAEEIEQEYRNFKKDGASRKHNVEYFKRRWNRLEELWNEFQFNHDQLCSDVSRSDPYFVDQAYEKIKATYQKFKSQINEEYQKFTAQAGTQEGKPVETEKSENVSENQNSSGQASIPQEPQGLKVDTGNYSKIDETLRKQQANFKAFARTIANINLDELSEKWEFEDALKTLETRWSAIDVLHLEIDGELDGNNLEYEAKFTKYEIQYHTLKKNINKKMWSVSYRVKFTPKLDIPIFSGNPTQWVSFKDLFSEAIHNNPTLSNGQKMQFLKGKVKGEAERLIQHLIISSDNYLTCWEILNHRYNNKRIIFTSQLNILLNLNAIQQPTLTVIKKMHDVTVETLHAIKNLGVDITTWDPIIVHILSQKLDSETYADYMESVKNPRELPILQELLDFLESKFTSLETSSRRKQEFAVQKTNSPQSSSYVKKQTYYKYNNDNYKHNFEQSKVAKTYHTTSQITCPLCENGHGIYKCREFLQMPDDKKLSTVNKLGICINCLFSHNGKNCTSIRTCRKCTGHHNTIMHDALERTNMKKQPVTKPTSGTSHVTSAEPEASTSHVSQEHSAEVLLGTAQLKVLGVDGTYHNMRALIDQGSQISLITEHAAQILGIKRQQCKGVIYGVGQKQNNCKGRIAITCASIYNDYTFQVEAIIMNQLIKNLPNKTFAKPTWSMFQNVNLADPEFYISRPVDLLLGADIYSNIIMKGIIKGDSGVQPIAQQTQLGWLLCGNTLTFQCNVLINNLEEMQQFWEIEDVTNDETLSAEDIQYLEYFQKTTQRNGDGRYEVRLPMKPEFENRLGVSKPKAIAQFRSLEQKFRKQETLSYVYKQFMNEYQALNHMKPHNNNNESLECYLPHHGVERADSLTTKYRVVFNASSKTSTGCSLNDLMYKGPNLQKDLQSLILTWRQYPYAFTADIEKMYRQILLKEEDQSLQKIFWRQACDQPIQTFKLTTVTYGTKAAPFLAMMTLRKLATDERKSFPNVSKILEESFYMDDLVYGAYTVKQGNKIVNDLTMLLKLGGFNLRKWCTNKPEILEPLIDNQTNNHLFNFKTENTSKTLGLSWDPKNDKFIFECEFTNEKSKLTKRRLLSEISKIFDPLGWLAPVVTKMKLLFQTVWKTNINWDDQVSDDIDREWSKLQADIHLLQEITLPRWILCKERDVIELHGFCDASQKAYACVIYARMKKQTQVVLVAAKTKLVPLNKTVTLPRLELCGAHLLSTLMKKVIQALNEHTLEVCGWTDSKVVLGWLQGEPNRWKPFVASRVKKITDIMPQQQWRYVSTSENPADVASRGIYASQLKEHALWWTGPSWMSTFETNNAIKQIFQTDQDMKLSQTNIAQQGREENIINNLLIKHSNFAKVTRIVAWIQRALTPKHKCSTYLHVGELRKAKLTIIKNIQQIELGTEIEQLRKNGKVNSNSKLFNLNPFLDENNILRVGGRLSQADMSYEFKHPKIIPRETRLANLLIEQAHQLTFHGGPRLTMAYLRQEYWINGGNNYVKKQLRNCVTCRKYEGRKSQQLMGELPSARINPAKPFHHTGVDYTGFIDVKYNKGKGVKTTKGYVAIFICMVTKAVHLELVSDLSSSAFLAALRRMVARRGAPQNLYSDNGTNFVGTNKILEQEWKQLQQNFGNSFLAEIAEMNINWHFNAPAWPSAGGLWERAVRSLKHHLRRVIGEQKLTFEEYATVLAQLEACLNSRPLCPLTENIEDLDFLTPAHFLTGRAGVTIIETPEDARTRWHLSQKLFQDIWKRWKAEYLSQLTARGKWQTPKENIKIGDMVVIHGDNLPPGKWGLGRVVDVHPGSDGYVRVVTLKTKNGFIKRPIVKLSVLPLSVENNNKQSSPANNNKQTRKPTSNKSSFVTIALMCFYLLSIISGGLCLKVTKLDEQQGLYFDRLANMQLIQDEWKVVAYYDMQPYWEGTAAYQKYYNHLNAICTVINQLTNCEALMLQLHHAYNELEHNNKVDVYVTCRLSAVML